MSFKGQAARGFKWQALEIVGRQLIALVVFTTLTRLLDRTDFGLVGLMIVYLAFAGSFTDQGVGTALVQRKELEPGHLNAAFWFNVSFATLLCVLTIVFANSFAAFLNEPRLAILLRWGSLALIINASSVVQVCLFTRDMDFRRPMLRTLLANVIGGVVGIGMAINGFGVWALIGQQLTSSLAGTVFVWSASNWRPSFSFSVKHLKQLIGISSSSFVASLLWLCSSRLDQICIGRFLGAATLGEYVVGLKLADIARGAIHVPIGAVSLAALSRLQGDNRHICRAIYAAMRINALVSFAVFVGLAAVSNDLIPVVFAGKWASAVDICILTSLYALLNSLQVLFYPALIATGSKRGVVILNGIQFIGVAIACLTGAQYGVNAIIVGLIVNGLVFCVPWFFLLRKRLGLDPLLYCQPCLMPAIASFIMAGSVWGARWLMGADYPGYVRLGGQIITGAVAYIASIAVLSPDSLKKIIDLAKHALINRQESPADSQTGEISLPTEL